MQSTTPTSAPCVRLLQAWLSSALVVLCGALALSSHAQTLPAYYSTGSNVSQITQPPTVSGTVHGSVSAAGNAADDDFATYATLTADATADVGVPVALRLKLTGEAPAGYRAGVVLANASGVLSLNAIGTITLRTYLTGASPELREQKVVRADLVRAALLTLDRPTQLEFTTTKSFDAVEIEIGGLLNVNYTTNIFYAYGVRPGVQTRASGYISRLAAPTAGNEYSTTGYDLSGLVSVCVLTDVDNPQNVADASLTNYATFKSVLTVSCQPSIKAKLADVPAMGVPAGYYAGFVVGQEGLLDVGLLSGLRVRTFRNGTQVQSGTGAGVLELTLLPENKAQIGFRATAPFDAVSIERTGLLTAVDNLRIYYAYGLAPSAFNGLNPVLSDFTPPVTAGVEYSASNPQDVAATLTATVGGGTTTVNTTARLSNVDNPAAAADNDVTNYAQINIQGLNPGVTSLTSTARATLKLKLNGTGRAGNRVGMVISRGLGLLDLNALNQLTLSTYDASNQLIETKSGADLLFVSLLNGSTTKDKISFLASRDFTYVELEVKSAAGLASNTQVYYGFAEDVPLISLAAPLPVELTAFGAKWNNGAADLTWATASEKSSSHFVVERSTGAEAAFSAVGQVEAAGNSTQARTYKLRDVEAGAQGVGILYYRLRQVDVDGSTTLSPVVALTVGKLAATPQLQVYPNPASGAEAVLVRCPSLPASGGVVLAYSQLGQLVGQVAVGATNAPLQLPALTLGFYHVVLRDASGQTLATQRLVIGNR
jgi:hypothetical protein